MKNQLLMLSMPNNGSDWLVKTITNSQDGCKYFREFFNPGTNPKYSDILGEEFGCEYITFYKKIISFDHSSCEQVYNKTWKKENYNFAKENYSFLKAEFTFRILIALGWSEKLKTHYLQIEGQKSQVGICRFMNQL
jgi:hypothetical protein